jgi:arginyl-tRNA synthetase
VITAELRRAIAAAAGTDVDPLLRPATAPGSYASSLPFRLAAPGQDPRQPAAALAASLETEPWIASAQVTGTGYLTVTITHDALAGLAVRIARAGPGCAASDALRGRTVPAPPPADPLTEPTWPQAQAALAAQLTARLAAAAGASFLSNAERSPVPPPTPLLAPPRRPPPVSPSGPPPVSLSGPPPVSPPVSPSDLPSVSLFGPSPVSASGLPAVVPALEGPVADAVRYAGPDAVRFALARIPSGGARSADAWPEAAVVARHILANPAYAVRYAHAAAAAVLRWAAVLGFRPAGFRPGLLAEPGELALLDVLSWLPERVAVAARRGRPDEFAGYLEELAARTIDTMNTTGFTTISSISSERLWLADAARTGLAAGLGLLGVGAPARL